MQDQPLKGLRRLVAAWHNSCNGLRDIWRSEEAFRTEVIALAFSVPASYWLAENFFQASLLVAVILLVILVETINTAIEVIIDRIGAERNELSRIAKDLGSLAVVLANFIAGIIWMGAVIDMVISE